jgi:hypothetical protein
MKKTLFILLIINTLNLTAQNRDDCQCGKGNFSEFGSASAQYRHDDGKSYRWIAVYTSSEGLCIPNNLNEIVYPKMKEAILAALYKNETYKNLLASGRSDIEILLGGITNGKDWSGGVAKPQGWENTQTSVVDVPVFLDVNIGRFVANFKKCSETINSTNNNTSSSSNSQTNSSDSSGYSSSRNNNNSSNNTSSSSNSQTNSSDSSGDSSSANNNDSRMARLREQERLSNELVTNVSDFSEGFSAGVFTDLSLAMNSREAGEVTDQNGNEIDTNLDFLTYELGIGVGRAGFFSVGYGVPANDFNEGSMIKLGMCFDIYSIGKTDKWGRHYLTLGIEVEYGFGDSNSIEDNSADVMSESGSVYGGALTLRVFEVLYAGLGYGFISSDISGPNGSFEVSGTYNSLVVGINIPF